MDESTCRELTLYVPTENDIELARQEALKQTQEHLDIIAVLDLTRAQLILRNEFGIGPDDSIKEARGKFKSKLLKYGIHPDQGGLEARFKLFNLAYQLHIDFLISEPKTYGEFIMKYASNPAAVSHAYLREFCWVPFPAFYREWKAYLKKCCFA